MNKLLSMVALFALGFYSALVLWLSIGWFLVPLGCPQPSYLHTFAISVMLQVWFSSGSSEFLDKDPEDIVGFGAFSMTLYFAILFIVHLFV